MLSIEAAVIRFKARPDIRYEVPNKNMNPVKIFAALVRMKKGMSTNSCQSASVCDKGKLTACGNILL